MNSNRDVTIEELEAYYSEVLPSTDDRKFIFQLLLDAIATCEELGSSAWSVTQLTSGFRLNVGQVEAMTCHFTFWNSEELPIDEEAMLVAVRLLLLGEDCLDKITLPHESADVVEMPYASVKAPHWCYVGTFSSVNQGEKNEGRSVIEKHVTDLHGNFQDFLRRASHTPTGKIRQKSNFSQHHCEALVTYAKGVIQGNTSEQTQQVETGVNTQKSTEAERQVVQRIGQDLFRATLLAYWQGRCCVTGLAVPELLRASHIRPWARCESDAQRLDVFNGLLLSPNLDALFDGGWVTFTDSGELIVSSQLPDHAVQTMGLAKILRLQSLTPAHQPYLSYHRENVFRG